VWENDLYALWRVTPGRWALIADIDNPNGIERIDDLPFLWLGGGETHVQVVAGGKGEAVLRAVVTPSPRLALAGRGMPLAISSENWSRVVSVAPPELALRFPLSTGLTTLALAPMAQVPQPNPSDVDRRPLVLGLSRYRIQIVDPL